MDLISPIDEPSVKIATVSSKLKQKRGTPFNRSLVLSKPIKSSWKKKMQLREEKRNTKAIEQNIKAEKQAELDEKKRRREENQKRREENARKAEIVQSIRNLKKIGKKGAKRIRKA